MFCKYCGKEVGESKFCNNCGHEIENEKHNEITSIKNDSSDKNGIFKMNETKTEDNNQDRDITGKSEKPKKKNKWALLLLCIAIYFVITFFSNSNVTDRDYISCAEVAISEQLTSPATAKFSDGKVIDKDKYGRAIVMMTVDGQNGFGATIRNKFVVVINSYDKKTGEFFYNKASMVSLENGEQLTDFTVKLIKGMSNWNEPIESN